VTHVGSQRHSKKKKKIKDNALSDGKHTGYLARRSNRWNETRSLTDLLVDRTDDLINREGNFLKSE